MTMQPEPSRVVIVIRPGRRTRTILGWLRQLVPAAMLVVAAPNLAPPAPTGVITLDEDDVASGPLSLADALTRHIRAGSGPTDPLVS